MTNRPPADKVEMLFRVPCEACKGKGDMGYFTPHWLNTNKNVWIEHPCQACEGTGYKKAWLPLGKIAEWLQPKEEREDES